MGGGGERNEEQGGGRKSTIGILLKFSDNVKVVKGELIVKLLGLISEIVHYELEVAHHDGWGDRRTRT